MRVCTSRLLFGQGLCLNLKHESDEFHFFEVVREKGLREAIRQRQELYAPLGGFGVRGERDFVDKGSAAQITRNFKSAL